jgi:FkbM family methyltransferase
MLEANDFRPAMRRFLATARQHRDILFDVDLREGAVVVDVGAYQGEWSAQVVERARTHGPRDLTLHAFEPEPESVERYRAALGTDPGVHLHPYGLAGRTRTERMTVGGLGSSVFKTGQRAGVFDTIDVDLRDIDEVFTSLAIDRVDLMMVNIEGGEYELIDRLNERGWLPRLGTLIVQFHEFGPDAYRARRRNRSHLAETHRCTWNFTWVYERWDAKEPAIR